MKKLIFAALLVASTGALSAFTLATDTAVKHDTVSDRKELGTADDRKELGTADDRKELGTADARTNRATNDRKELGTAD